MSYGKTLLFVYNADSGMLSGVKDYCIIPKSSGKEPCNLSTMIHTPIGMKKDWKRFVRELGLPARFLTRNEFISEAGSGPITFPAILLNTGKDLLMVASSEEINMCRSLEDLISLVRQRFVDIR